MNNKSIPFEEVYNHDQTYSGNNSPMSLDEFSNYEWTLEELDLDQLSHSHGEWTPDKPLPTEGIKLPSEEYNHEKYIFCSNNWKMRIKDESDYVDRWADEYYARGFAEKTTPFPAILVFSRNGTYGIKNGRHRSRAAFLRGEKSILAYVGKKKQT